MRTVCAGRWYANVMRLAFALFLGAVPAFAEPPAVTDIRATSIGAAWRFDVTVVHPDTGWNHYADGWRVELADGTILGTRALLHPHVTEQPFTRSLSGVALPDAVTEVFVRARCSVDGWSADTTSVTIPR